MKPKTWEPGTANDAWKVLICARDHNDATRTLDYLVYILTDAGADTERGLAAIRGMSGAQIVDALQAYAESSIESVRRALG